MVSTHRLVVPAQAGLDFDALRTQLQVPTEFPPDVLAQAEQAASAAPSVGADRSDIAFVTVDPPGSRDLDQALHIAPTDSGGYLVSYAIADVASFVSPGSALDEQTRRRGETLYFPDRRVPLHPAVLSEGAASLLPGVLRPAVLWQIVLDGEGCLLSTTVARAQVRSTQQLDYAELQDMLDTGSAPEGALLLAEVGPKRLTQARTRRAINLDLPEQEVEPDGSGGYRLVLREQLPVESWNAEISLLTGMCAAKIMLDGGVGLLRTLPDPDPGSIAHLQRIARALDVPWSPGVHPGDVLAGLDRSNPRHAAFIEQAAALLRGAGYTPFDGTVPDRPGHAGVGANYAHVTAALRRLVDRFGTEVCLALCAGLPVPEWVRTALPLLPDIMAAADHRAHEVDRAVVDLMEAYVLQTRVGETFQAVVLDAGKDSAKVAVDDPPVRATCTGSDLPEGERITVRLVTADPSSRTVRFEAVSTAVGAATAAGAANTAAGEPNTAPGPR